MKIDFMLINAEQAFLMALQISNPIKKAFLVFRKAMAMAAGDLAKFFKLFYPLQQAEVIRKYRVK
ncbi:MAG: hypothetical protein ACLFNW_09970 [Desulfobacterales bacterium]